MVGRKGWSEKWMGVWVEAGEGVVFLRIHHVL